MAYGDTLTQGSPRDYAWMVGDTMAYWNTLIQGSVGWVVVQGLSLYCWRYNGIQRYSGTGVCRMGGHPGTPWTVGYAMAYGDTLTQGYVGWVVVQGLSLDCQRYNGTWDTLTQGSSRDYPCTVSDTMAYRDALTQGSVEWVVIQGLSLDCQRYNGIRGYSDTGVYNMGGRQGTIPGLSEIQWHMGYSDTGVVQGLSLYCQRYNGI